MAPPQVKLNEKPHLDGFMDPLPEKNDTCESPVIVTMDRPHSLRYLTAEQRRQRKRCRIACCTSLTVILLLLLGLGTAFLIFRLKHKKGWGLACGTQDGSHIPEHVVVDHEKQLIYVKPVEQTTQVMEIIHEYNRGMIAFKNSSANNCYIDRLDETFAEGYTRWQQFEDSEHQQNRSLRVVPGMIQIEVVKHFAGIHIVEHCGGETVEYYWAMEITETEIQPSDKIIVV